MSIERGPSQQETQENLPSEISIYVVEETKTHKDNVTDQGFGYGAPLESPQKSSRFVWEGKLQPSEYERQNPQLRENYAGSSMSQDDIEKLAQNFAYNYRTHQNPDLQKAGQSSYSLAFEPSEEVIRKFKEQHGENAVMRGLNAEEQKRFMDAFRKANEEATKKK